MNYDIKAQLPHIQVLLNSPDYCKDKLLESWCYHHALLYHFKKEDFNAIDQLNDLLKNNVLEDKHNIGYFHGAYRFTDDKATLMARFIYLEENEYTPVYNIIYDYSNAKKAYLLSKGIDLPSVECAKDITQKIIKSLETTGSYDTYDEKYLKSGLESYGAILIYNELQESLPSNNKKVSKNKI